MTGKSRDLNTRGIIIKKIPFRETSLIVDVFSRELGHISLMAKGARSAKSKSMGHLELLNELELNLYRNPSSEWYIYKSSSLYDAHLFNTDFRTGILMQAAIELLRQIMISEDEAFAIYDLLHKYLIYIRTVSKNEIAIFWRFLLSLFKKIGIEFNLSSCAICNSADNFVGYYPQKHGFICKSCYRPAHEDYILGFSKETKFIFENLTNIGNIITDLTISNQTAKQINHIFLTHLSQHFHKKFYLKSMDLY